MDNRNVFGLINVAVIIASLVWMMSWGIGGNEKLIPPIVFSVALSAAVILFPDWFGEKE
ncbi:MAG: hypothetical protein JW789_03535 [Candidatus Aenigmarchaeota archaeon]|nr:hypothetical protein [Candidatus Aenigmarchaeota archaeon]